MPDRGDKPYSPTGLASYALNYTVLERRADMTVHVTGLILGVGGCIGLACLAGPRLEPTQIMGLALYAIGLLSMLGFSALYNLTMEPKLRALFRRLDHAGIFFMIAGTYSAFCLLPMKGAIKFELFGFVWTVALTGAIVKFWFPARFERFSVGAYLLLGWSGLFVLNTAMATIPSFSLWFLALGAALYTTGVLFHVWRRLPYHNAVWHCFVLAAAVAHYAAIVHLTLAIG